jgi:acetyl esterase
MARNVCRGARAVVIAVDYRLAPEHPFPAAAEDAVAAARWVAQHLDELGGDDRLAVAGDSAGGNLAAVVAQALHADGTPLAGQFLIYPAVDAEGDYPSRVVERQGLLPREGHHGLVLRRLRRAWDDARTPGSPRCTAPT